MKKIRMIITVALILLMGISWVSQIVNTLSINKQYKEYIQTAEECYGKGLYQKAIGNYELANAIRSNDDVQNKMLEAYRMSYLDGTTTKKEYANVLLEICNNNPKNVENWKTLLELHIDNADYSSAYSIVTKCTNRGIKDDELDVLMNKVRYSYTEKQKTFTDVLWTSNGYYTLCDGEKWGIMTPSGDWLYECEYEFVSPISNDMVTLLVSTIGNRIVDEDGIVQAIISEKFLDTNSYGEGILPVQKENGIWQYYSCNEDKFILDKYEYASAFSDGEAVVLREGKWSFIDVLGEQSREEIFDDIKYMDNGAYMFSDIMIASVDGVYHIYDSYKMVEAEVELKDADVYVDGYIAYMDGNNKWGFVNKKGEVVIEPQFEDAKSFSNGLAAVCKDGLWGFINKNGDLVIDYQFLQAEYFTEGGICFVSSEKDLYHIIQLKFN